MNQDFEKQIPRLTKPVSFKMKLFPGYYYLVIKKPYQGKADFNKKRYFETTNTLHRDIHFFMKRSSQNIVNKIEKEKQLNLTFKNQKNVPKKKQSKRMTKIFMYNSFNNKIEVVKEKDTQKDQLKLEKMLDDDVDNEMILAELREEEPSFGHYLLLEFDENHLVTKIEYMGRDEPHLKAFQNLFGLHRTFFNLMFERRDAGLLNDFVEFISQEWGRTLSHPMFGAFKFESMQIFHLMCQSSGQNENFAHELFADILQQLINKASDKKLTKKDKTQEKETPKEKVDPAKEEVHKASQTELKEIQMNEEMPKTEVLSESKNSFGGNSKQEGVHSVGLEEADKENVSCLDSREVSSKDKERFKIFLKDEDIFIKTVNKFDPMFLKKLKFIIDNTMKNYKDLFESSADQVKS
jgi:hypothetical protein